MNRRTTLLATLTIGAVVLATGCGDDSGGAGGTGGTEGSFLLVNRIRTPDARAIFLTVLPSLDVGPIDRSALGLEVPGLSRGRVYNGKVYVFDGESGVISRYVVDGDRLALDVLDDGGEARFSMADEGITNFTTTIAFIDPERAYYIDTRSGNQVVVWNPTEMSVTSVFPVPELVRDGFTTVGTNVVVVDDLVVLGLSWTNEEQATLVPVTAILVLSATEDVVVGLVEDDRCVSTRALLVDEGDVYAMADANAGLAELFAPPGTIPPPCLLRWVPGSEDFDPDFYRDLREIVGEPLVSGAAGRGDGTFVTQAYTSDIDFMTLEPLELIDGALWQWAMVDFRTDASTLIESIAPGGISRLGWIIEDEYLVSEFDDAGGTSALFQIDSPSATELLSVPGEIFGVDRIQ